MSSTMVSSHPSTSYEPPRMLRTSAVAEMLDLPEKRVYELVRAGKIPHVRVGRSVRFNSHKLREWLDAGGTGYGVRE